VLAFLAHFWVYDYVTANDAGEVLDIFVDKAFAS
jgi:hypothetical protein